MRLSADRYQEALRFAAHAHGDQKMSGSQLPYLAHLTSVASEVIAAAMAAGAGDEPFDLDLAATAALLHDTVEDTAVKIEEVAGTFGPAVAQVVLALTKDPQLPKDVQMADSLARIVALPGELGRVAAIVKLADRTTNLQVPPSYWKLAKRRAYLDEGQRILQTLVAVSRYAPLEQRLADRIAAYPQFLQAD